MKDLNFLVKAANVATIGALLYNDIGDHKETANYVK